MKTPPDFTIAKLEVYYDKVEEDIALFYKQSLRLLYWDKKGLRVPLYVWETQLHNMQILIRHIKRPLERAALQLMINTLLSRIRELRKEI